MTSDIQVDISGGPFTSGNVTGVSISYGYNMIPAAMLTLNVARMMEKNPAFFENPTQFKKSTKSGNADQVHINIKTVSGCISFSGFFDGLSVSQAPGGLEYTAIIKSKFQVLTELYPKLMGMYPGSTIIGRSVANLTYTPGGNEYAALQAGSATISADLSPCEFYIEFLKKVCDSQKNGESYWSSIQSLSSLRSVLESTDYKANIDLCTKLIDDIDISYAKAEGWRVTRDLNYHADLIASGGDDAWSLLLNIADSCGCVILISDKKLHIVPQSNFMKLEGSCPSGGEQSTKPNQAYPADYSNFILNDNSYKNIRYCFVSGISSVAGPINRNEALHLNQCGSYPAAGEEINPDDGASGILLVETPPWMGRTIAGAIMVHSKTTATNQTQPYSKAGTSEVGDIDEAKSSIDSLSSEYQQIAESKETKKLLDNYAQARFLTEKYSERTGSFSLQFNPQWVPATTGFLASRQPKIMFNFFVTGVTHSISVSDARVGSASTQVSFNSARYGGNMGSVPGIDSNVLYGYDTGKMKALQESWLSENSATFKPRK